MIFLGFVAFYFISFMWDIFTIRGGYLSLAIAQSAPCVDRTGFANIGPALILVLLFTACFHAISLVWIIGFLHSRTAAGGWRNGGRLVDVPGKGDWLSPFFCVPNCCFETLMVIQFGLGLYVYLFLEQLVEEEPEAFVERYCVSFEDAEAAMEWMSLSMVFFVGTLVSGCVYCCMIRVATDDISILQPGQQSFEDQRLRGSSGVERSGSENP